MMEGPLVGGEAFSIDASLIKADVDQTKRMPGDEAVAWPKPGEASRAIAEYLAALDAARGTEASDDGDNEGKLPKQISLTDPQAAWVARKKMSPFFAYDAGFRGGVDVPAASQGSGYAGPIDIASFGWGAETSAAEASGPMKESMETMKKAWKDASSTPEGAEHAAGANWACGDGSVRDAGDAAGPFVAYGDGFMGGVFVGASDAVPNGRLYLA